MKRLLVAVMVVLVGSVSWLGVASVEAESSMDCQSDPTEACYAELYVGSGDPTEVFSEECNEVCNGMCSFVAPYQETYEGHWEGWFACDISAP